MSPMRRALTRRFVPNPPLFQSLMLTLASLQQAEPEEEGTFPDPSMSLFTILKLRIRSERKTFQPHAPLIPYLDGRI